MAGNLRNEDFRKLLATPGRPRPAAPAHHTPSGTSFTHKQQHNKHKNFHSKPSKPKRDKTEDEEEEARLKEILKNYRDRAAERRVKGGADDQDDLVRLTAAYRAVPSNSRDAADKAHLRKQVIEESKFLGGDMEHTHLVKGLDYSLLQKVRSEIHKSQAEIEQAEKDELEDAYKAAQTKVLVDTSSETQSENKMVRNMQRLLFKNELPLRNELFGKRRMAYVVELEDEEAEIPTTLLRSVIDCPHTESNTTINANNMLISKLTQVLGYLRADHKKKKGVKNEPDLPEEDVKKYQSQSIYENETEYVPNREKDPKREKERKDDRDKDRKRESRNYFDEKGRDRDRDRERDRDRRDRDRRDERDDRRRDDRDRRDRDYDRDRDRREKGKEERDAERQAQRERDETERQKRLEEKIEKRRKEAESGGYDECYPGGFAELGGAWDSDEEDFSKMDLGNKKANVKRWDFDTEEDFEKYQSNREANPKAAYQFGLKSSDGRKTRKSVDQNKKLDRELQQINAINEKRKAEGDHGDYKRPKY